MNNSMREKEMTTDLVIVSAINISVDKRDEFLDEVMDVEKSAWPPELQASREKFESRAEVFPQGFIMVEVDGKIKGFTTSEITTYDLSKDKTWNEITDNGMLKQTHNPLGDSLYVASVGVSSDTQGKGIGGKLVEAQIELVKQLGLKRLFLGARISGYDQYCRNNGDIQVDAYLKLRDGENESIDPEIRFYERQGLKPMKIVPNFEPDSSSRDYGIVMVWENPLKQVPG